MASVIANEFSEASDELYLSALIEIGLALFIVTIIVNALGPGAGLGGYPRRAGQRYLANGFHHRYAAAAARAGFQSILRGGRITWRRRLPWAAPSW
jgi:hypothetical protein